MKIALALIPLAATACAPERSYEPKLSDALELALCATSEEERLDGLSMLAEEARLAEEGVGDIVSQLAQDTRCANGEVPPPPPGFILETSP